MDIKNKILFIMLMLFLSSVVFISYFQNRQIEPLRGTYKKVDKPLLSWSAWFSGDYQIEMDKRTNSRFFLRSVLIKIRNQIDFDLFDKVNADVVLKGKGNILFDKLYIESYLGLNFIGEDTINLRLDKIKSIQDTLSKLDKKLLIVIAPSKAAYFSDSFPIKYDTITKSTSNYDYYSEQLIERNINHIDFNKLFLKMKDTILHPLYPNLGTHWNNYARLFVWNTIVENLEQNTDWNLTKLRATNLEMRPSEGRDNDLYHLLNIYNLKDTSQFAYHTYTIDSAQIDKPNGLVIADSYYWGLYTEGFSREVLNDGMYWYYNNTIYPEKYKNKYEDKKYNTRATVLQNEIIILLTTAANLHEFPFGFEDDLLFALQKGITPDPIKENKIQEMIVRIRNNEDWFSKLREKAQHDERSLDSILYESANYFLQQEGKL